MKRKKAVLFVAFDSGGAAVLAQLITRIIVKRRNVRCLVFAGGPAKNIFASSLPASGVKNVGMREMRRLALLGRIDLAVSGTGVSSFERNAWRLCKKAGVRILAFVDAWNMMAERLAPGGGAVPDRVGTPDSATRKEMVALGFPISSVFVAGQPYLEAVAGSKLVSGKKRLGLKRKLGIERGRFVLLFASEQFGRHYAHYGYSEYDVIREVVSACELLSREGLAIHLLVKLHPEEKRGKYGSYPFPTGFPVSVVQKEISSREALSLADLVCGSTSVILLESALCGVPAISVQPGMAGKDNCRASSMGLVQLAEKKGDLSRLLEHALIKKEAAITPVRAPRLNFAGSCSRALSAIDAMLGG
jgi:hypothetical protein